MDEPGKEEEEEEETGASLGSVAKETANGRDPGTADQTPWPKPSPTALHPRRSSEPDYKWLLKARRNQFRPMATLIDPSHPLHLNKKPECQKTPSVKIPPLRPSVDGQLSSWPAYRNTLTVLKYIKPCSPGPRKRGQKYCNLIASKPYYLKQLEDYLRRELTYLDLIKENNQELRFQPFKEVFEFFIEDFKDFRPLLTSIKNAYEFLLGSLREKIRALEPLQSKLITLREEHTQKIHAIRSEEKLEIKRLNEDKVNLFRVISEKDEEVLSLQAQVARLQKSLSEEYLRYRNESDARKVLLADLIDLRYHQEDLALLQPAEVWRKDPVQMNLALKMARRDLTQAQEELNIMRANFGDVVPLIIFQRLEKKYNDLVEEAGNLRQTLADLLKEYDTLVAVHKEVWKEREQLTLEVQEFRRSSTPRPDWSKCPEVVAGGIDRWKQLTRGKNSDQMVDVLLEEIGERLLRDKEVFPGLGKSDEVPVYLRHVGAVKNRKLCKKEVLDFIKDFWKAREEEGCQEPPKVWKESLPEYFLRYIKQRYGDPSAMEWTYSIYESLRIFRTSEIIRRFYDVLIGKVDESTVLGQNQIIAQLLSELSRVDVLKDGLISLDRFSTILTKSFPLKTEEQFMELFQASGCALDDCSKPVQYRALFIEDEDGNTGPFIHKLRSQYLNEKLAYLQELRQALEPGPKVNAKQMRAAFIAIDPSLDAEMVDNYAAQAFQCPAIELELEGFQPVETLLKQLRAGTFQRAGPQNPGAAK
ncbi:translin-associated factor X-interacting protein 1 [Tachyglossus aculeatus]|uniref:translin-associated factor X-interacting protein 1 n=1 Tax=Tachyglossus aculeatus TaxID=9261 RepID=UPI0018F3D8FA|nr:translin-associated factor X-interacting protein 1 [Tachyglossus aculeatus]